MTENAFEALFVAGAVVFTVATVVFLLSRARRPASAVLEVGAGRGLDRHGLGLLVRNDGDRLTAVEDVFLVAGDRRVSLVGLRLLEHLPRDLLPGESVRERVASTAVLEALRRLRPERPRFGVEVALFGGESLRSGDLELPPAWKRLLRPRRRRGGSQAGGP